MYPLEGPTMMIGPEPYADFLNGYERTFEQHFKLLLIITIFPVLPYPLQVQFQI